MTEWTRRDIDIAICLLADIATGALELAGYRNPQVMRRAVQYAEEMQKQREGGYHA